MGRFLCFDTRSNCRVRCRVGVVLGVKTGRNLSSVAPPFGDLLRLKIPPGGHPPYEAKGPVRPSNTNTRGKSDLDVIALWSCDATLIEELVSVHQATDLHQAFDFTQFPELRIALCTYRSRLPAVDGLGFGATLPPLRRFRPCRGTSVRPTDPFVSHCGLATL